MKLYRLTKRKYANLLDGEGASIFGSRWNSKGVKMIYTASSRSLAMAEVLVNLSTEYLPTNYVMVEYEITEQFDILSYEYFKFPKLWYSKSKLTYTQNLGDEFVNQQSHFIMQVPSVVVLGDFNYLINPNHPDIVKLKILSIVDFPFDSRLFYK
jgi:RES domain-containing protein